MMLEVEEAAVARPEEEEPQGAVDLEDQEAEADPQEVVVVDPLEEVAEAVPEEAAEESAPARRPSSSPTSDLRVSTF